MEPQCRGHIPPEDLVALRPFIVTRPPAPSGDGQCRGVYGEIPPDAPFIRVQRKDPPPDAHDQAPPA